MTQMFKQALQSNASRKVTHEVDNFKNANIAKNKGSVKLTVEVLPQALADQVSHCRISMCWD
jgi:hypothetical protein